MGKTQLAARYAESALASRVVDVVLWVDATSRKSVVRGYEHAAAEWLLRGVERRRDGGVWTLPGLLRSLDAQREGTASRWLVVLDGLLDPSVMVGLWPPISPLGRTLITTSRRDAGVTGAGASRIDVRAFSPVQATAYLRDALPRTASGEDEAELAGMAADLGYLPLALSQAAAYVRDSGRPVSTYRRRLADPATRLSELFPGRSGLPDGQSLPLCDVLTLVLSRVAGLGSDGLAVGVLGLASMLDPDGAPEAVFTCDPSLTHLARFCGRAQVTADHVVGALRDLYRLGVIDHDPGARHVEVRLDRLLARAVREGTPREPAFSCAGAAAAALLHVWPDDEHDQVLVESLRANTMAVARTASDAHWQPGLNTLLLRRAHSLGHSGRSEAAVQALTELVALCGRQLGPEHPDTFVARGCRADGLGEAGRLTEALAEYDALLPGLVRAVGPDDPLTFKARLNRAHWLGVSGRVADACAALQQLLDTPSAQAEDSDLLALRFNLADLCGRQGDPSAAVRAYQGLLEEQLRSPRADERSVLATRCSVSWWLARSGDFAGALDAYVALLPDLERVRGRTHEDCITARHNVAHLVGESGDAHGAVIGLQRLLDDLEGLPRRDHPRELATRTSLEFWRARSEGRPDLPSSRVSLTPYMLPRQEQPTHLPQWFQPDPGSTGASGAG